MNKKIASIESTHPFTPGWGMGQYKPKLTLYNEKIELRSLGFEGFSGGEGTRINIELNEIDEVSIDEGKPPGFFCKRSSLTTQLEIKTNRQPNKSS